MSKICKKLLATLLVTVATVCSFTGCSLSSNKGKHSSTEVLIKLWSSGTGTEFLQKAIDAFNAKNTGYTVSFESSSNSTTIASDFGREGIDNADIWMYAIDDIATKLTSEYAEPLNDILESTYEGESKKIGDKFESSFLKELKYEDGNYYSLSYGGGWYGIVYNTSVIDGVNYKVPRTTYELENLVIRLYSDYKDGKSTMKPWINWKEETYWKHMIGVWQAQYDTLDYVNNTFWKLKDADGNSPSLDVLTKKDGRYKALQSLEKMMSADYAVDGSNTYSHTEAQTYFLNNKAVLMVNGSWLLNEMRNTDGAKTSFAMMKSPVISSIVDNCPSIAGEDGGEPDEELCALIDAIDKATSSADVPLTGEGYSVTEADRDRVYEARNLMASNFDAHGVVIPKYATSKEGAKEFLKYFYSDENLKTYWETTQLPMMIKYSNGDSPDMSTWDAWSKSQQEFSSTAIPIHTIKRDCSPIFTTGGAAIYATEYVIKNLTSRGEYKGADKTWESVVNFHTTNWANYKTNAQI